MNDEKDLSKLSDSELDNLIEYGINQQENVPRHGEEYQHFLNVVATAKEEKAKRGGEDARVQKESSEMKDISDKIQDTKVEEQPLSKAPKLNVAKDPTPKQKKDALKKTTPRQVVSDSTQIPADKVNQGLPGVTPEQAETTPENKQ